MDSFITSQNEFKKQSIPFCYKTIIQEQKISSPESFQTQCDNMESSQSLTQKLNSIFNRLDTDLHQKSIRLLKSRCRPLKSFQFSQNLENVCSQDSFTAKNSTTKEENEERCSNNQFALIKDIQYKQKEISSLNSSEDESENDFVNSTYQKSDKSEQSSLQNSQQKKVSFQNTSLNKKYESDTKEQFQNKCKVIVSNLEKKYMFQKDECQKQKKSIFKRSQTFEMNSSDEPDQSLTNQLNMDFCGIKKERLVQYLLENETYNSKHLEHYFYSEMVTKISRSGEKSQRIIFITHNSFFVLQDLYNEIRIINYLNNLISNQPFLQSSYKMQYTHYDLQIEKRESFKYDNQFITLNNTIKKQMNHNYNLETIFSNKNIFSDQNNISPIPQGSYQFFMKSESDFQSKKQVTNNQTLLKSKTPTDINYFDTDIQDEDTLETANSINILNAKSFSLSIENEDQNIQQELTILNIKDQQNTQNSSFQVIQKEKKQDNDYFGEISQNETNSLIYDTDYECENCLKNSSIQNTERTEVSSIKSPSQKRVTFNEQIEKNTFQKDDIEILQQKIQAFLRKCENENKKQESLGQIGSRITKKTILKTSQSWEQVQEKQQQYDAVETTQFNLDYCEIIQEEIVQQLLQLDDSNEQFISNYFFSELVTKMSHNGERKKRIIFFNHESFYVLKNLSSHKGIQKFSLSEINRIVVHTNSNNINNSDQYNQSDDIEYQGLLQFFDLSICISSVEKCQEDSENVMESENCKEDQINTVNNFTTQKIRLLALQQDQNVQQTQIYLQIQDSQHFQFFSNQTLDQQTEDQSNNRLEVDQSSGLYQNQSQWVLSTFEDIKTDHSLDTSLDKCVQIIQQSSLKYSQYKNMNQFNQKQKQQEYQNRKTKTVTFKDQIYQNNQKRIINQEIKRSQTYELPSNSKNQSQGEFQTSKENMDFLQIKNQDLIQYLLQMEICNSKYLKQYFFSELVTKISSSGDQKQRIVFTTHNSFYVLKSLKSNRGIQKFDIRDINSIMLHSSDSNICSIVVRNILLKDCFHSQNKNQLLEQSKANFQKNSLHSFQQSHRYQKPTNMILEDLNTDIEEGDSQQNINFINNFDVQSFSPYNQDQDQVQKHFNQLNKCLSLSSYDSSSQATQSLDLKSDDSEFKKQDDFFDSENFQDQAKQKSEQSIIQKKHQENDEQNQMPKFNEPEDNPLKNKFNMDFYVFENQQSVGQSQNNLLLANPTYKNNSQKIEQLLQNQQKSFYILLRKISKSDQNNESLIQGILQIFSNSICIAALDVYQDLNRLTQVQLVQTNQQNMIFIFQSLKNPDIIYEIQLQNSEESIYFLNQLQKYYSK
ncbi:hypothetical protein ABPG74_019333 [Tetrahymena malaccensis]